MIKIVRSAASIATFLFLLVACYSGTAAAQPPPPPNPPTKYAVAYCPDNGSSLPSACTKTITIYNNYSMPIYPVIQGTLEQGPGVNGCLPGDRWLQAAFGSTTNCYPIVFNYLIYVNGISGIAPNTYASVNLPWWSKRAAPDTSNPDVYIDWWNGARTYIFDDQNAVNASYSTDVTRPVVFAPGSPQPACATDPNSVCKTTIAYQTCVPGETNGGRKTLCVPGTNAIAAETPQQLNEYTLASVDPVYGLTNWNVNYNVSNVDQVYLPVAMEPMVNSDLSMNNPTNTVGYLGTTLSVGDLRNFLMAFTGATGSTNDPQNPTMWPIYTVPTDSSGNLLYPSAGIRVPGAANVFNFLAQPSGKTLTPAPTCAAPNCIPTKDNGPVWSGTTLVDGMIAQWMACTGSSRPPSPCYQIPLYSAVNNAFQTSYTAYYGICGPSFPPWLAPVAGTNYPNLYAFLQFVYGWVPFNVACAGPDLPTGTVPRQYINLEDNFQKVLGVEPATGQSIFNPYAQLIHGSPVGKPSGCVGVACISPPVAWGLDAAAYAYSIDDQSSFLSQPGVGLIFTVGGPVGLPNPAQYIFPPPYDPANDIQVILGGPLAVGTPAWQAYTICPADPTAVPSTMFPNPSTGDKGSQTLNLPTNDPTIWRLPCYLTLLDASNQVYQIEITQTLPWPTFNPPGFNQNLMTCPTPTVPGYINIPGNPNDPNNWCGATQMTSNPSAPQFILSLRPTVCPTGQTCGNQLPSTPPPPPPESER